MLLLVLVVVSCWLLFVGFRFVLLSFAFLLFGVIRVCALVFVIVCCLLVVAALGRCSVLFVAYRRSSLFVVDWRCYMLLFVSAVVVDVCFFYVVLCSVAVLGCLSWFSASLIVGGCCL